MYVWHKPIWGPVESIVQQWRRQTVGSAAILSFSWGSNCRLGHWSVQDIVKYNSRIQWKFEYGWEKNWVRVRKKNEYGWEKSRCSGKDTPSPKGIPGAGWEGSPKKVQSNKNQRLLFFAFKFKNCSLLEVGSHVERVLWPVVPQVTFVGTQVWPERKRDDWSLAGVGFY